MHRFCILATALGLIVGILRLSSNPLLARLMPAYVQVLRNIPLLLQRSGTGSRACYRRRGNPCTGRLPRVLLSMAKLFVPTIHWTSAYLW